MAIELPKDLRAEALASLERYLGENFEERVGNIAASALLTFFIEEVGPVIYNKAVVDVQERLAARVQELDLEIHEDEFQYWRRQGKAGTKARR
jgi:uncharacterized protein (DUF2164 family)